MKRSARTPVGQPAQRATASRARRSRAYRNARDKYARIRELRKTSPIAAHLRERRFELGLTQDWPVVIVGIGNLGAALANYGGFASRGFRVAALIDADSVQVGKPVAGLPVRHTDELETVIGWDLEGFGQCLVNAIRDGPDVVMGFTFEQ